MSIFDILNRKPYASEVDKAWDDSPLEPVTSTGIAQPSGNDVVKTFVHQRLPLESRLAQVRVRHEAFEEALKKSQNSYRTV